MSNRKVILYIAISLDGYIAKPGDDLSFLSVVQKDNEDYGYGKFIRNVDTVILGRRTYDWVMSQITEFPYTGKDTYVITRTPRTALCRIKFYSGKLKDLISALVNKAGKNIFIDGGAQIVNSLLKDNLIDEFYISVIPVLLGEGIRLFENGRPEKKLKLIGAKQFEKGLVQLHYIIADDLNKN